MRRSIAGGVSIPRSEFSWFGLGSYPAAGPATRGFQFPVRNSAGLDRNGIARKQRSRRVSIPRSEFSWFGLGPGPRTAAAAECFNSPFGIQLVWTYPIGSDRVVYRRFNSPFGIQLVWTELPWRDRRNDRGFQFPVRNSAGLDLDRKPPSRAPGVVSIPRSEFSWFGPLVAAPPLVEMRCGFNSPFGIQLVWTLWRRKGTAQTPSFNSPFGIQLVWTGLLSRGFGDVLGVSIPRSEFSWFGPVILICFMARRRRFQFPVVFLHVKCYRDGIIPSNDNVTGGKDVH